MRSLILALCLLSLAAADSSTSVVWLEKEYFHVSLTNAATGRVNATSLDGSCLSLYLVDRSAFESFVATYSRDALRRGNVLDHDCTDTYAACTAKFRPTELAGGGGNKHSPRYLVLLNRNWSQAARFSLEFVVDDVYAVRAENRTVFAGKYHDSVKLSPYAATWDAYAGPSPPTSPLSLALLAEEDYARAVAAPGALYGANLTLVRERDLLRGLCDERVKARADCWFEVELSPLHEYVIVAYSASGARVDYELRLLHPDQLRATWVEYIYTAWNLLKGMPWGWLL